MTQCPADEANVEGKWPRTIRHYIPPAAVKHKNVGRRRCILYDSVGLSTIRSCLAWQMPGEAQVRDGCIQIVHTQTMSDTQSRPNATRARRQSTPCRFTGAQKQTPQYAVQARLQSKIATSILENSPTQSPPLSKRRAVVGGGALALLWYAAIRKKPRGPLRSPFPSAPFTVEPRDWTLSSPGLPPRVRPFATRVVSCWDFSPDPDRKSRTGNQKPGGTHTRTHTNMERK
mmetsp:Transcript_1495/g.2699  ORF Transcript_1495/g.2699 Transcript_1495/m.2699 type:complete len:230 (-) Transcript_1495:961-1650(-)